MGDTKVRFFQYFLSRSSKSLCRGVQYLKKHRQSNYNSEQGRWPSTISSLTVFSSICRPMLGSKLPVSDWSLTKRVQRTIRKDKYIPIACAIYSCWYSQFMLQMRDAFNKRHFFILALTTQQQKRIRTISPFLHEIDCSIIHAHA